MKTKATLLTSIAISTVLLMSSMVSSPVFGIQNSSAATQASNSLQSAPLAPVAAAILPGATAYNSSLDWTEYTGPGTSGLAGDNYSPQTQVTESNINQLQVSYIFPLPSALTSPTPLTQRDLGYTYSSSEEGTQSSIITSNGIAYALTNFLNIYGFDLATGAALASPKACPATPTGSSLGALLNTGKCSLGAPGEMDPAFDLAAWAKNPASVGGPSHVHNWNIVNGIAWVTGWGCQIQGWQVSTGQLVANLTGMCTSVPGDVHPTAGVGKTYTASDSALQVSTKYNEIIFYMAANGEGTGGMPWNAYACSLSLALSQFQPGYGSTCSSVGNSGACNTSAGGTCSTGSAMLWRTFFMPAYDGSTPNFAANLCAKGHVWIGGVPCSSVEAVTNVIQVDGQRPDLASQWGGDPVAPSTGCSEAWGQMALDEANGIIAIGTGDTGPDWNSTLRMGPSILCNAVVGLNLQNGTVAWADKSLALDINDQDCNLNTLFVRLPTAGPTFVKTCKSAITFAMNGITGQPLWMMDPSMPNPTTVASATTSPMSAPMICSATNATACDLGRVWDHIYHRINELAAYPNTFISGSLHMQGTNPHPHGFITPGPTRGSASPDPLNATEMGSCTGIGTAGVACTVGMTCPTGMHAACVLQDVQGKGNGFYEERYMSETEDALDPATGVFYTIVMSGPQEHDWIGDVSKQGQAGLVGGTNLYFGGQQTTNATLIAINIASGTVMWNYTRPIYYRGGIIVTGGMVVSNWPDGYLIFNDEKTGAVVRDINVGIPLLAPFSIAPDSNGIEHMLIPYGGTNHGILGEPGLHGPLGHGYVTTGGVISYVLGPAPASTSAQTSTTTITSTAVSTVTGPGGSTSVVTSTFTSVSTVAGSLSTVTSSIGTTGVSDLAFYGAVGVAAILAIVAGALVVLRRRPSA